MLKLSRAFDAHQYARLIGSTEGDLQLNSDSRSTGVIRFHDRLYETCGTFREIDTAHCPIEASARSLIYTGLKPGTTRNALERALANGSLVDDLTSFWPKPGDAVYTPAGTVHSLGGDIVVFEIQQNSDVRHFGFMTGATSMKGDRFQFYFANTSHRDRESSGC